MSGEERFPPYTYTPGVTPHPVSDPSGHSYGRIETIDPVDSDRLRESPSFRRGLELFRRGYYWEAHEEWEAAWHAIGRRGPAADVLKGLIKLAAAGVKAREGNAAGVRRHATRAVELLTAASAHPPSCGPDAGQLRTLAARSRDLADRAALGTRLDHGRPIVFWPDLLAGLDRS